MATEAENPLRDVTDFDLALTSLRLKAKAAREEFAVKRKFVKPPAPRYSDRAHRVMETAVPPTLFSMSTFTVASHALMTIIGGAASAIGLVAFGASEFKKIKDDRSYKAKHPTTVRDLIIAIETMPDTNELRAVADELSSRHEIDTADSNEERLDRIEDVARSLISEQARADQLGDSRFAKVAAAKETIPQALDF